MLELRSYSSPFNLGHRALKALFDGPVVMQEKIDGSQFSFGVRDGELFVRSRGQMINQLEPGMFDLGVKTAQDLHAQGLLREGWTYRGEYLRKPKQNTLVYDRVPLGNVILFDVDREDQDYLDPLELARMGDLLDLETVPYVTVDHDIVTPEWLEEQLKRKSILGNVSVEGYVFKNYERYDPGNKTLMGKYVSPKFRELHDGDWKKRNPGQKDFIGKLIAEHATEARWDKARQHLLEAGELENEPRDIPKLMKEIGQDVLAECGEDIKERLFKHFWKQIQRGLTKGLPEYYKRVLMKEMLDDQSQT